MNDELEQYINSIKHFGRIDHNKEKELSRIIQRARKPEKIHKAREQLIHSNLLLVVDRAYKMQSKYSYFRLNIMDLISEGNIGLMRAAETYSGEHESNAVFGTYACKSIDRRMFYTIQMQAFIHLPNHYLKYRKQLRELKEKYGDKLTDEIIAKEMDISEDMLETLKDDKNKYVVSLEDTFVSEDGETSGWSDIIEDVNSPRPDDELVKSNMMDFLNKYILTLNEREQFIIKEKHLKNVVTTYDDLSIILKISRERIRQIHHKALRKLRILMSAEWQRRYGEVPTKNKMSLFLYNNTNYHEAFKTYYQEEERINNERSGKVFKYFMKGDNGKALR